MYLGTIKLNEKDNIRKVNLLFIWDCRDYIKIYCKSKKYLENIKRLNLIGQFIRDTYHINRNIVDILLELTRYLKIGEGGSFWLDDGNIDGVDVNVLFKLILNGNLSLRGVPIMTNAFKYATLKKNWRR